MKAKVIIALLDIAGWVFISTFGSIVIFVVGRWGAKHLGWY